jgi:hypothetical protein
MPFDRLRASWQEAVGSRQKKEFRIADFGLRIWKYSEEVVGNYLNWVLGTE